jgi:hypothetical protein
MIGTLSSGMDQFPLDAVTLPLDFIGYLLAAKLSPPEDRVA